MTSLRCVRLLPLLALGLAGHAHAEAADTQGQATHGADIVVTGNGLERTAATRVYSTSQVDADRLASAASGRLEDALADVAGFQQFRRSDSRASNPSAQGVTLRALGGNATSRALVLLDGVPMADPFFGYVPLSALAPERLARAVVTRGGGAGAFGAGALSGTIELDSAGRDSLGPVSGQVLVDNRGETEASASLAPKLGDGFAVISGRWDRGEGFWTTPADQRVPASVRARYDSWSTGARAVAPLAPDVEIQARVLAFEDNRTLRFAGADTASRGEDGSVRIVGHGRWGFDALAYVQARDFSNVTISATKFVRTLDQRATPSTGLGAKFELRPPVGGGHVLRLGADWRRASGETIEDAYSVVTGAVTARRRAGGRTDDLGFFAEDEWQLGKLLVTGGGRADRTAISDGHFVVRSPTGTITRDDEYASRSGWDATGRGGLLWHALPGLDLRGAVYSSVRLPTLNELYREFTVVTLTTQANANLKNERLFGYEAGLDLKPAERVHVGVTAFDNRIRDAIANVTIVAGSLQQRQNVPEIRARGVELDAAAGHGPVDLSASLAWTDARVHDGAQLEGKRPAQTPSFVASGTLSVHPMAGALLSATVRRTGRAWEDDLQTAELPPATTLGLFAQVPLRGALSLVLRAENVTDTTVVTRNSGGTLDIGVPRTVWAGFRWGR